MMDPIIAITVASWVMAVAVFFAWRKYPKAWMVYLHLALITAPLLLWARTAACGMGFFEMVWTMCHAALFPLLMYVIPIAIIVAFVGGYFVLPWLYAARFRTKQFGMFQGVTLMLMDTAKPIAFSLRRKIFVSVGMYELLNRKEQEAVLLHELGHIKYDSSWNRFAAFFVRLLSPVAYFKAVDVAGFIADDEAKADRFAIDIQKTSRFINSARGKLRDFYAKV